MYRRLAEFDAFQSTTVNNVCRLLLAKGGTSSNKATRIDIILCKIICHSRLIDMHF